MMLYLVEDSDLLVIATASETTFPDHKNLVKAETYKETYS